MAPCRFFRLLDRIYRRTERINRRIDAMIAERKRKDAENEARLENHKRLLKSPKNRDRPN